ncbi:hypothetical protein GYM62_20275 [Algoriphagus sp. NBT04N3]|jgi:hypothetical protein|uniref:hypothetical protein n=1 Tax=Algoriphagus sp. NBT04N3 TaxID=2705473 RepID=UPI001C629E6F|nr:hypothetical protein [Algoriphagus sp. NBT04N3]QYH41020.1 hypothetical protein GYM62_20275 [Algoriphagus sp. NBT04N3]
MWIASKNGFLSVVQHREKPDQVLVRARVRKDLETIFPDESIIETPEGDYRFRVFVSKQAAVEIISQQVWDIDYPNFKNAISDTPDQKDKLNAYHEIWAVMWNYAKRINKS